MPRNRALPIARSGHARVFARAHKYGAKRTEVDGVKFQSKAEARRWQELLLLQRAGEIRDLRRQVRIELHTYGVFGVVPIKSPTGRPRYYLADFEYYDQVGRRVLEDVKGMDTPESALKRAIVEGMLGIKVQVVK